MDSMFRNARYGGKGTWEYVCLTLSVVPRAAPRTRKAVSGNSDPRDPKSDVET